MARDKLSVTCFFNRGSESSSIATIWSVRGFYGTILSDSPFTWEPAQETHRKEARLIKYSGLKSCPIWTAFKYKCIVLVNLHREGKEETARLVNQSKHWVILSNQWDDTSLCRIAFLNESHFEHSWGLSCVLHTGILLLIPVVTPNVTTYQMPPTLSKPQPLSAENSVYYLREKMKSSPFLLSQRNGCLCPFLSLGHWIPASFYILWELFH